MVKADTLSDEKREGILKALSKFRQRILWKWENETLPNQPPNVFIRKWMPQREILCEKFLKIIKEFLNLKISTKNKFYLIFIKLQIFF
jgi:glucuronosyltransferase